jgi:hypothetical protein
MTLLTWHQSNARVDQLEHELDADISLLYDASETREAAAGVAAETRLRPGITLGLMVFLSIVCWAALIGFGLLAFYRFGRIF